MRELITAICLVGAANAAPILGFRLMRGRWSRPLDGGERWLDGRRLLGVSKTVRGVAFSIVMTALLAYGLGVRITTGVWVAVAAMAGDALSSFVKRRMGKSSGDQAMGIDQIPEMLFPLFAMQETSSQSWLEILLCIGVLIGIELGLSPLLFKLHLRKHPY